MAWKLTHLPLFFIVAFNSSDNSTINHGFWRNCNGSFLLSRRRKFWYIRVTTVLIHVQNLVLASDDNSNPLPSWSTRQWRFYCNPPLMVSCYLYSSSIWCCYLVGWLLTAAVLGLRISPLLLLSLSKFAVFFWRCQCSCRVTDVRSTSTVLYKYLCTVK